MEIYGTIGPSCEGAEVSDIYNAVLDGAAAVILTGETAAGEYLVEAMEYLVNTVKEAKLL